MKSKKYATYVKKSFVMIKIKKSEYELYHKVRDHCHYTGKFRGAAHNICNLRYKVPKEIPIVFHNGSVYDYHFVIKKLGGRIMKEFCALRAKTYSYSMDDNSKIKKSKGTKKCVVKRKFMFENYEDCLFNDKIMLKSQQRFKSDLHKVYTEEINKIAQSSNDDKRLQTSDTIKTYPYGTNAFKVCENEMLEVKDLFLKNYNKIVLQQ